MTKCGGIQEVCQPLESLGHGAAIVASIDHGRNVPTFAGRANQILWIVAETNRPFGDSERSGQGRMDLSPSAQFRR